jgi:hypothetical protein
MIGSVSWRDTPVIVRKVATTIAVPTADDCVIVFSGFVDSVKITLEQIQLTCSNDLGSLLTVLPSENMHQNCRFQWGDDWCTALRWLPENYKAKTCGASSTTTRIVSADLTEDDCTAPYLAQAVTADSGTDKVTLTSHGLGNGDRVKFGGTAVPGGLTAGVWYYVRDAAANDFKLSSTEFGDALDLTSAGTSVTMDTSSPYGTDLVDALGDAAITASSERAETTTYSCTGVPASDEIYFNTPALDTIQTGDQVIFGGTPPDPLVAGIRYWVLGMDWAVNGGLYLWIQVSSTQNGAPINITDTGTAATIKRASNAAEDVRRSQDGTWVMGDTADWGTLTAGFWQIPDAQAGLQNVALKPWIAFDFGAAVIPKVWRIALKPDLPLESCLRMLELFSSSAADFATSTFEGYLELPPRSGEFVDWLIPKATSARYWRICVRSRWSQSLDRVLIHKVSAHANARHWWSHGRVTFDDDTTTVALRGISRMVRESWDGALLCDPFPVAPANGDTFHIERDCPRHWNACSERRNWTNFGGFLDLPFQSVIRAP